MENINSINNFNIAKGTISSQKANLAGQETQSPMQSFGGNQTLVQNFEVNQALMYNPIYAKMDNETILNYLQNLLKLPNSIEKFINEFISDNKTQKTLELLSKNLLDVKELAEFLNRNSKDAIEKLLQTISLTLKSGVKDTSQMREILAVLNNIQTKTDLNMNMVKELLLLYIPINLEAFNKESDFKVNEELKEKIDSSLLSIMIETINFSNILCCINENQNKINIDLYADNIFPSDKLSSIIKELSKENLANVSLNFIKIKGNNSINKTQNFKVVSEGFIPVNTLLMAHLITKIIFKIDLDFTI